MDIKKQVAKIVEQSHPGCGQKKECYTNCGECGADQIHPLYLAWFKEIVGGMQELPGEALEKAKDEYINQDFPVRCIRDMHGHSEDTMSVAAHAQLQADKDYLLKEANNGQANTGTDRSNYKAPYIPD